MIYPSRKYVTMSLLKGRAIRDKKSISESCEI